MLVCSHICNVDQGFFLSLKSVNDNFAVSMDVEKVKTQRPWPASSQ